MALNRCMFIQFNMRNVIDLQFENTKVPFVQIGVSGTIYVGPNSDLALVKELSPDRRVIRYLGDLRVKRAETPDGGYKTVNVKSLFYDLNAPLIEEAAAQATRIFDAYTETADAEALKSENATTV